MSCVPCAVVTQLDAAGRGPTLCCFFVCRGFFVWSFFILSFKNEVKLRTTLFSQRKTTKGTHKYKVQMPEKNNCTLGKGFLEILLGVLLATRFCLSHAWPQPHCLLLSPQWQQKGKVEALGASSPARQGLVAQQECWEKARVAQTHPLMPFPIQPMAQHRGSAHGREWSMKHPQMSELTARAAHRDAGGQHQSCPGCWAQPLLHPGLLLPAVQPQHSPALQGPGRHCQHCTPCVSSGLSLAPAGSCHLLHCPKPEMCFCHTSGRASTARTRQDRNLQLWNHPPLQRGSKPYTTTARHPSQVWRGWGGQGVHVINIKSATKRRHILYIFDPYTQEHNIHRTPRRSGDVVRRFLRDVVPLPAPPLCLPHTLHGAVLTQHQSPKVPPSWQHVSFQVCVDGVVVAPWCLPCCPGGEVGEEDGEDEGGQARGTLL